MKGTLAALVLARRKATRLPFVPREVTPEEQAEFLAQAERGEWDRQAEERAETPAMLLDLARRAARAFRRTRAQPPRVQERVYGARRDGR